MIEPGPLLLFDGTCGFCARSVQFVLQREHRRRTLRFAALDSSIGREVRAQYPELDGVDSVVWVDAGSSQTDYRLHVRSEAVFRVLKYLGGVWTAVAVAGAIVPRSVRDWVYDFVARHRHKIIPREAESCLLPSPEQRARFIDWEEELSPHSS
jgi:predicted DCC family thiol-disulfide oxidoreductase YuxK